MIKSATDRRTLRTKKTLKEAFTSLLEEKGFNNLTITDITLRADINRGTFYLHYMDKYDLLEQIENELFEDLKEYLAQSAVGDIQNITTYDKPVPFVTKLFEYMKNNGRFMKVILSPNGDPYFQSKLKSFMQVNLFANEEIARIILGSMLIPQNYFISYIISAHIGVVQQWLEDNDGRSPEEMALILSKMFLLGPAGVAGIRIKRDEKSSLE